MGIVGSRVDEGAAVFLRDQTRFSVAGLTITTSRGRTIYTSPNTFPATRFSAKRDATDDAPVEYIQDPDPVPGQLPAFILRLSNEDELTFTFTCIVRQQQSLGAPLGDSTVATTGLPSHDTSLAGLTYVFSSNQKEIDQLVTREFHANPNLHKNSNVELVGDYTTGGTPAVQFTWAWKWRPPKPNEDRTGGWRNTCSFVEYNQRAHRLDTLASFSFWVQNAQRFLYSPHSRSPRLEQNISPPRLRVPSTQSIESRVSAISDSDGPDYKDAREPASPMIDSIPEYGLGLVPTMTAIGNGHSKVDVNCVGRPAEDLTNTEDGPVFRATMRALEQKTGTMRSRMKRVLRAAEAVQATQTATNDSVSAFMDALRDASTSNANAVRPALDHYFDSIAKEILLYEKQNNVHLQKLIIEPISKLYSFDIKQAEAKKRDFDEESKEYYNYVGKYLGQRSESLKEKKRVESDAKYQSKRRTFELKRFDYSSFMHDLNGGRKEQEVLSQLTKYADAQTKGYLRTSKKVEEMLPQLEALCHEVSQVDKEFQMQRTEREEKRRALETNSKSSDNENASQTGMNGSRPGESDSYRAPTTGGSRNSIMMSTSPAATHGFPQHLGPGTIAITGPAGGTSNVPMRNTSNKFKGFRDLEETDTTSASSEQKKQGLLWSLSRPGSHVDPIMNKAGWHKFWIVLDQGKLSEYANWKDRLDLHMEPIDLRVASVREARTADRRFCFEIITPQFTRVYQAPSEEDMKSWISAINNALQSAFETRPSNSQSIVNDAPQTNSTRNNIAAVLTGKSTSFSGHRTSLNVGGYHSSKPVSRHATTGDKPTYLRGDIIDTNPSALLTQIREADAGNRYCADCGSEGKVEWVSINLGIILCIECSGIHRSLGTHISKVRSLTLDTSAFTPDIVDMLLLIGNRISNMVWEAKLDRFLKPSPHSTREQRLHFISAKYSDRAYVQSLTATLSHFGTADETLLASIKKNDIQNVLYALALRANLNATDRSRSTHAVFLALAAADPASPSNPGFTHGRSGSSSTISAVGLGSNTTTTISSRPTTPTPPLARRPFPVAELLLQNGADIPTQPAPIPLSATAKQYLEFKIDQKTGRHLGVGVADSSGDGLSALPSQLDNGGGSAQNTPRGQRDNSSKLLKRSSLTGASKLIGGAAADLKRL